MPDIDVDFCMRGRDRVIRYVAERYDGEGDEGRRVAQIITFGKLQARAVVRDVGRVLGMPYGEVDRLAKLIPETLGVTLDQALSQSAELRARVDSDGRVKQLFDFARRLEGLTRHASTHAAGVVIANQPLIELVPLYKDPRSGQVMTQWDMRCIEKVGLIKFDFLGLKTLTVIADAERQIRERRDSAFDIQRIPLDDPQTYDLLCRGDTEGVFQVESPGMTELTVKLKPRTFKELIPIVALYRPGPLGSGMVEDYINRKHGLTRVEYLLPELEELTAETLGVIVYQDQVLQIANRLAGYSLGEADLLRRAMGKKKPAEMEQQRERFIAGCNERQVDPKKAEQVFNLMAEFAGYGFAKSHATAYALITCQTAYLRANHPREFLAALLTNESSNHKKLARYIAHARERSISVLPPCVTESSRDFTVVEEGVRFGLAGVKNLGEGAIEAICEARSAEEGSFGGLFDFARRVDGRRVNRRALESLIKCGALDSLHANRAAAWSSLDTVLESGASAQRDREVGQESLFGPATREGAIEPPLRKVAEWTERERLAGEKEVLGFYVTGHPLDSVAQELARYAEVTATTVEGRDGREVRAGGLITGLRETRTRRGDLMSFGTLEDLEGGFDLVIFAEPYARLGRLLKEAVSGDGIGAPIPLIVCGTLEVGETPKLLVRDAFKLEEAEQRLSVQLRVRVRAEEATADRLTALRSVLESSPGDCSVFLHLAIPGESETILAVSDRQGVRPEPQLLRDVDALFGRPVAELSL